MFKTKKTTNGYLLLAAVIMLPIGMLLEAHTLRWLWHWFVRPMFEVPALPILYATGLVLLLKYIIAVGRASNNTKQDDPDVMLLTNILFPIFVSQLVMFEAWIIQLIINR